MTQHSQITDPDLHEPKGASTAGVNRVLTSAGDGTTSFTAGALSGALIDDSTPLRQHDVPTYNDATGMWKATRQSAWNYYRDSVYTSSNKLALTTGARTKITINGATETILNPPDASLYGTTDGKITPEAVGDTYLVRLQCKADTAATTPYFDLEFDAGGSTGVIDSRNITLTKGGSATNNISATTLLFVDSSFLENGAEMYITTNATVNFWDFTIMIHKLFGGNL